MTLRGYGWSRTRGREAEGLSEGLARFGFVKVEEAPGRELVFGLVGRFWKPRGDLRAVTREEFLAFGEEGWAKAAWNLAVAPSHGGKTELSTETRVLCFGDSARRRFRLYWAFIAPFSDLTRRELLRGVRRAVRRDRRGAAVP
jgi:hypothetical protein